MLDQLSVSPNLSARARSEGYECNQWEPDGIVATIRLTRVVVRCVTSCLLFPLSVSR